jgi:hypothetical protein
MEKAMTKTNDNNKSFSVQVAGIKCDNINCDYEDDSVSVDDYENYLNKPCPICGENLLTQADYDTVKSFLQAEHILSGIELKEDEPQLQCNVSMNGTGEIKLHNLHNIKTK